MRPRNWRIGPYRFHTCLLWPECYREWQRGSGFWVLACWRTMTDGIFRWGWRNCPTWVRRETGPE